MRYAAATDANQAEIVKVLRAVGCSVQILATVGKGCPDLLVGFRGRNLCLEVKDGSLPPSHRELTPHQRAWHASWAGQVAIVTSVDEALAAIGLCVAA